METSSGNSQESNPRKPQSFQRNYYTRLLFAAEIACQYLNGAVARRLGYRKRNAAYRFSVKHFLLVSRISICS